MTNEQLLKEVIDVLMNGTNISPKNEQCSEGIPVGISNRHIHLSQEDLEVLFGPNYQLTKIKDLKQPGQYAAKETVTISGPKGSFSNVRILGPVRNSSQVEISKSDSFALGIKAPIRESGDLNESGSLCVIGPKGSVIMNNKVIVAKRHIHMSPQDAEEYNVKDKEVVWLKTKTGERTTILGEVIIRVDKNFKLECHLDTDEANATSLGNNSFVEIFNLD